MVVKSAQITYDFFINIHNPLKFQSVKLTLFIKKRECKINPHLVLFEENKARQHMQRCEEQNFVMILMFAWRLFL